MPNITLLLILLLLACDQEHRDVSSADVKEEKPKIEEKAKRISPVGLDSTYLALEAHEDIDIGEDAGGECTLINPLPTHQFLQTQYNITRHDQFALPNCSMNLTSDVANYSSEIDELILEMCMKATFGSSIEINDFKHTGKEIYCGGYTTGNFAEENGGGADAVVIKLNLNGDLLWSTQFGKITKPKNGDTSGNDYCNSLAFDNHGGVFCGGYTTGNFAEKNSGVFDPIVFSLNRKGQLLWAKQFGGKTPLIEDKYNTGNASCDSLEIYANKLFCIGTKRINNKYNLFTLALNTGNGRSLWMRSYTVDEEVSISNSALQIEFTTETVRKRLSDEARQATGQEFITTEEKTFQKQLLHVTGNVGDNPYLFSINLNTKEGYIKPSAYPMAKELCIHKDMTNYDSTREEAEENC